MMDRITLLVATPITGVWTQQAISCPIAVSVGCAVQQTRILNCSQGRSDTAFRICGSPNEIPFLMDNAEKGGYHLLENYMNGAGTWPGYMVDRSYVAGGKNYEDDTAEHAAEIRDILRNKAFRQALSAGFDRHV